MAQSRGGGSRGKSGRSVPGGSRGRAVRESEEGMAAAGRAVGPGGTGAGGAAGGPVGGSGGGGGKAGGSVSCGRTERGAGAWSQAQRPSPSGPCDAGWPGGGCGR